jgi:hypothetical protein
MNQPTAAHEAMFRVGPLVNLASLVQSLGCDPGPIFRQSGFDLEEFQDPDHWLPTSCCTATFVRKPVSSCWGAPVFPFVISPLHWVTPIPADLSGPFGDGAEPAPIPGEN